MNKEDLPNIKKSIEMLIDSGMTMKMSYKTKINEWYSDISISKFEEDNVYYIAPFYKKFSNREDAVSYFITEALSSKNKGYIQNRLRSKIDLEKYNIEKPSNELKKLFREEGKLVDEEFKLIGVKPYTEPSKKEAEEFMKDSDKLTYVDDIRNKYIELSRKYAPLDIYVSVTALYKTKNNVGEETDYRAGFKIESLTQEELDKKKKLHKDYKFQNIEITYKIGNGKFNRVKYLL